VCVICVIQMWYSAQMKMICEWLSDRLDIALHPYQLTCLLSIVRVSLEVSGRKLTQIYYSLSENL